METFPERINTEIIGTSAVVVTIERHESAIAVGVTEVNGAERTVYTNNIGVVANTRLALVYGAGVGIVAVHCCVGTNTVKAGVNRTQVAVITINRIAGSTALQLNVDCIRFRRIVCRTGQN